MKKRVTALCLEDKIIAPTAPWGKLVCRITSLTSSAAFGKKVMIGMEVEENTFMHMTITLPAEEEIEVVKP